MGRTTPTVEDILVGPMPKFGAGAPQGPMPAGCWVPCGNFTHSKVRALYETGAFFSEAPIINGPGKL